MSTTVTSDTVRAGRDLTTVSVSIGVEYTPEAEAHEYGYVLHDGPQLLGFGFDTERATLQTLRRRAVQNGVTAAQRLYAPDHITVIHRDQTSTGLGLAIGNMKLDADVSITRRHDVAALRLVNSLLDHGLVSQYQIALDRPLPTDVTIHADGSGGEAFACGWAVTDTDDALLQCGGRRMDYGDTTAHTELSAIALGLLSLPTSSDVTRVTVRTDSKQAVRLYNNLDGITDDTLAALVRKSRFRAGNWKVTMTGVNRENNYLAHSLARAARYGSFASYSVDWLEPP